MKRDRKEITKACILGHCVADALGVPVEFSDRKELDENPVTDMRGYGTYPVPEGSWSDDTSMTLCALESLSKGSFNPEDIMKNFGKWYYGDCFTPTGKTFDVGRTCRAAIERYFSGKGTIENCGGAGERDNGNGSLMRIIPFVLFGLKNGYDTKALTAMTDAGSALTHAHERSKIACGIYALILRRLIDKPEKTEIAEALKDAREFYGFGGEIENYARIFYDNFGELPRNEIKSDGYAVHTLEAAIWCLLTTDSYKECVLKAVNLGNDTDTVGAVAGGLAGALYGYEAIPEKWLNVLKKKDEITALCEKMC